MVRVEMQNKFLKEVGQSPFLPEFKLFDANLRTGIKMRFAMAGSGSPVMLAHGHPHTHVIWRKVAPELAKNHTVILPDLRGYGDTDKPEHRREYLQPRNQAYGEKHTSLQYDLSSDIPP